MGEKKKKVHLYVGVCIILASHPGCTSAAWDRHLTTLTRISSRKTDLCQIVTLHVMFPYQELRVLQPPALHVQHEGLEPQGRVPASPRQARDLQE